MLKTSAQQVSNVDGMAFQARVQCIQINRTEKGRSEPTECSKKATVAATIYQSHVHDMSMRRP